MREHFLMASSAQQVAATDHASGHRRLVFADHAGRVGRHEGRHHKVPVERAGAGHVFRRPGRVTVHQKPHVLRIEPLGAASPNRPILTPPRMMIARPLLAALASHGAAQTPRRRGGCLRDYRVSTGGAANRISPVESSKFQCRIFYFVKLLPQL